MENLIFNVRYSFVDGIDVENNMMPMIMGATTQLYSNSATVDLNSMEYLSL